MKLQFPVLITIALSLILFPARASAGDAYKAVAKIYVFQSADLATPTAVSGTFAASQSDGHWSSVGSPGAISFGSESLKLDGPEFSWTNATGASSRFKLVSEPAANLALNSEAKLMIGAKTQYMEKQADGSFLLREVEAGAPGSAHCDLVLSARPANGPGKLLSITCRPEVSAISGREKVPGLELEVGKPIIASYSDALALVAKSGAWSCLYNRAPGGSDYGLLVLLKVTIVPNAAPDDGRIAGARNDAMSSESAMNGDSIRVGAVIEVTGEGEKVSPPSAGRPVFYEPLAIGYREMGGRLDFWQRPPPPVEEVKRSLEGALANQGYQVAQGSAPASLVLVFRWGVFDPEMSPIFDGHDSAIDRIDPVNGSATLGLIAGRGWYDISRSESSNAREFLSNLGFNDENESRYFLIVSALDAHAFARGEQVLLWRAHVTTLYWGHYLDQVLGSMIRFAAPQFGRATPVPRLATVPVLPLN